MGKSATNTFSKTSYNRVVYLLDEQATECLHTVSVPTWASISFLLQYKLFNRALHVGGWETEPLKHFLNNLLYVLPVAHLLDKQPPEGLHTVSVPCGTLT